MAYDEVITFIIKYKLMFIALGTMTFSELFFIYFIIVLIIGRINGINNSTYNTIDMIPLNEEEEKLFRLTKKNTNVNRDIPHKEKNYLKNAQPKYEELYGDRGSKFCQNEEKNENNINNENAINKKVGRVKFSTLVEYSRN